MRECCGLVCMSIYVCMDVCIRLDSYTYIPPTPTHQNDEHRAMDALRRELSEAEARAATAEKGRATLTAEVEGMGSRLQEAQSGMVGGELRRLQAELRATKTRLDTAQTNQTLLQRYIAVRRLSAGVEGKENAAPPVPVGGKGEKPVAAAADGDEAQNGVVLHASYLMPTH